MWSDTPGKFISTGYSLNDSTFLKSYHSMGVRQGESGQEAKDYSALRTEAAPVPDPIVTLIMGLLPSPAMADDRIEQAERTPAKNQSCTGRPVES
jgi:hypothetical protein